MNIELTIDEKKKVLLQNNVIENNNYDNANEDFETESLYDLYQMMSAVGIDGKNIRLFKNITDDADFSDISDVVKELTLEQKALFEIFMNTLIVKYQGYKSAFDIIRKHL